MKQSRVFALIGLLVAIAFFIKLSHRHNAGGHSHTHADGTEHVGSHEAVSTESHSHEGGSNHETGVAPDHDVAHVHAEGDGHDHDADHGHEHDVAHVHAEGDGHDHQGDAVADHDHQLASQVKPVKNGLTDADFSAEVHVDEPGHVHDESGAIAVDAAWEAMIGLQTTAAIIQDMERVITLPGKIMAHPDKKAMASPLIGGSINFLFVQVGDRVAAGDELACLSSPEIGNLRAEYDKAKANHALAEQNYHRKQALFNEKVISKRAFEEVENGMKVAEVARTYAQKRLMAVGVLAHELDNPPAVHSGAKGSTIHVHAPIDGVVTTRNAFKGQQVNPSMPLFEIVDASEVWCEVDLFEKDLKTVQKGQPVHVRVSAYPDQSFDGSIFHVGNTLNAQTKTIKLLASLPNPKLLLKPGMYAVSEIVIGSKPRVLSVPRSAILEDEQLQVVFVREGNAYHRHVVKTGIVSGAWVEILEGLTPGAIVVTQGNYQLRSKARMGNVDPHAGHVH